MRLATPASIPAGADSGSGIASPADTSRRHGRRRGRDALDAVAQVLAVHDELDIDYGVLRLKLDNGPEVPVFCIQIQVRVRAGDRYRSAGAAGEQ